MRTPRSAWCGAGLSILLSCALALFLTRASLSHSPLWEVLPLYLGSMLFAALAATGCTGLGFLLLSRFSLRPRPLEALSLSFCLGQGIVGLFLLAGGLIGILPRTGLPLFMLFGVFGYWAIRTLGRGVGSDASFSPQGRGTGLAIISAAGGLCLCAASLLPPYDYDVLGYHLALPKRWASDGWIRWTPDNVFAAFPSLVEMVFTWGLLWRLDTFANLWILANVLCLACLLADETRDAQGRLSWAAPAILFSSPLVFGCGTSAYNDIPLTLFSCLSLLSLVRGVSEPCRGRVILAGLMAGLAMGTKYHGFIYWALSVGTVGAFWAKHRPWRSLLLFSVVAWACASPWLMRNLAWTGNPFFPLAPSLLGGGMSEAHAAAFSKAHSPASFAFPSLFGALGAAAMTLGCPLALAPLLLGATPSEPKRLRAAIACVAALCLILWLLAMNRTERFLAFPLALVALLIGQTIHRSGPAWARIVLPFLCGVNLLCTASGAEYLGLWRAVFGGESRTSFLAGHVQCQSMAMAMQDRMAPSDKALLVGEARTYPFEVPVVTSYPFSTPPIVSAMEQSTSSRDLWAVLREQGITHVLLNLSESERLQESYDYFHPYGRIWEDPLFIGFLEGHCDLVLQEKRGTLLLYALKP